MGHTRVARQLHVFPSHTRSHRDPRGPNSSEVDLGREHAAGRPRTWVTRRSRATPSRTPSVRELAWIVALEFRIQVVNSGSMDIAKNGRGFRVPRRSHDVPWRTSSHRDPQGPNSSEVDLGREHAGGRPRTWNARRSRAAPSRTPSDRGLAWIKALEFRILVMNSLGSMDLAEKDDTCSADAIAWAMQFVYGYRARRSRFELTWREGSDEADGFREGASEGCVRGWFRRYKWD